MKHVVKKKWGRFLDGAGKTVIILDTIVEFKNESENLLQEGPTYKMLKIQRKQPWQENVIIYVKKSINLNWVIIKYSWTLNNTDFNFVNPLICGFFQKIYSQLSIFAHFEISICSWLNPQMQNPWVWRAAFTMPFYIRDLSICRFWHMWELLEPISCRYRGTTVLDLKFYLHKKYVEYWQYLNSY